MADRLLIFWEGGFSSRALPTSGALSIGRSPTCDVAITHSSVSRKHATLHLGEHARLEDLGSSNGTRVGGTELPPMGSAPIAPGDVCEVGSVLLVVERLAAPPIAPSPPASPSVTAEQAVMIPPPPAEDEGLLAALGPFVRGSAAGLSEELVQRAGAPTARPIDVRIIASTTRDLRADAATGAFREDLLLRLCGITLTIPPLRERAAEIGGLARLFIAQHCRETGRADTTLTPAAVERLTRHRWPGNIRELKRVIERALRFVREDRIDAPELPIDLEHDAEEEVTDLARPRPSAQLRKEVEEFDRRK